MAKSESPIEEALTQITAVMRQIVDNQKAIHADVCVVNKNVEYVLSVTESRGIDPEEFRRLQLDVAAIEQRTRNISRIADNHLNP